MARLTVQCTACSFMFSIPTDASRDVEVYGLCDNDRKAKAEAEAAVPDGETD